MPKSPFLPSSSTVCLRSGPKADRNGLNVRYLGQTGPKPSTGRILGYVAQKRILGAPIPPATPHFLWFPSLRIAQRDAYTPILVVTWWGRRAAQPVHGGGPFRYELPNKIPVPEANSTSQMDEVGG